MNQKLVGLLLFAGVFVAAFLLLRDSSTMTSIPDRSPEVDVPTSPTSSEEIERIRTSAQRRATRETTAGSSVTTESSADKTLGSVLIGVTTDDGLDALGLRVEVLPSGGERKTTADGRIDIGGIAPGIYTISVTADEYLTRPVPAVVVEAGKRVLVNVALDRASFLAGTVTEETFGRPLAGASIDFNGLVRATSDLSGNFRTAARIRPTALDVIHVHHPDYDSQHFLRMPITDIGNIRLSMGRGKGTLEGRIIALGRREAPPRIVARVLRPLEGKEVELRREVIVVGKSDFRIEGVYDGPYVLEVEFPGSSIAGRREEFDLTKEPDHRKAYEFLIPEGPNIIGTLVSRVGLHSGVVVELVDEFNRVRARSTSLTDGKFSFDAVPAGEWRYRVDGRVPTTWSTPFKVEEGRVLAQTMELESGRFTN